VPGAVVMAPVPLGLLIAAFLWVNEFPDYEADKSAGKKTLVVRLGKERAVWCFLAIQVVAFIVMLLLRHLGLSGWLLLGEIGLIPAVPAVLRMLRKPKTQRSFCRSRS
jgi:1,4-dihydroxy-2-naphthoate octaprenyltransferase